MSRPIDLTPYPVRVTGPTTQDPRFAHPVMDVGAFDLLLRIYEGSNVELSIITAMQTEAENNWIVLGSFPATSAGGAVRLRFWSPLHFIRWKVTSSGTATFGLKGRALPATDSFSPVDLSGCVLWLRSDRGIELSGSTVSAWSDQSGSGNGGTQATSSKQPLFVASDGDFGGKPTLVFDGPDDYLGWSSFSAPGSSVADGFFVLRADNDPGVLATSTIGSLGCGSTSISNNDFYPYTDGVVYSTFASSAQKTAGDPSLNLTTPHLLEVISSSTEWTMNLNGAQQYTTGTNTFAWIGGAQKLGENDAASRWFAGRFAEIAIYDRKLDDSQRTTLESYLGSRYGISVA